MRLAVELIEALEITAPGQWDCGFLTLAEMESAFLVYKTLPDVDGTSRRWLWWIMQQHPRKATNMAISGRRTSRTERRFLLLEREASPDQGWLAATMPRGYSAPAVFTLFDSPEPVRLESVGLAKSGT